MLGNKACWERDHRRRIKWLLQRQHNETYIRPILDLASLKYLYKQRTAVYKDIVSAPI